MADFTLEAEPRSVVGKKVKQVRGQGWVPATIYGPKMEPLNLQFPYRTLQLTLMKAGGTNLIDIQVGGKIYPALARSVQRHSIRGEILHVDFFAVDINARIRADIPVHVVGQSPAVAAKKGVLMTGANSITIEVLASKLINQIEIDLAQLVNAGDTITVGDLKLGDDVTIINDPDEIVVKVIQSAAARAAEDLLAEEETTGPLEPEVIHKGKQEEE